MIFYSCVSQFIFLGPAHYKISQAGLSRAQESVFGFPIRAIRKPFGIKRRELRDSQVIFSRDVMDFLSRFCSMNAKLADQGCLLAVSFDVSAIG